MLLDLPYVCEFCYASTRKINRMDVSDDEVSPGPRSLLFVCGTCRDKIMELACALAECDDENLHIDFQADELETHSEELVQLWNALRARRKRF